jgi:lactoylglutathione lyase
VPGALVVLLPFCEEGDEELRIYSAFTDNNGAFVIQVPAEVECRNRVVLTAKPGFLTPFADQPNLVFDGSSQFTNQDPELTPGAWAATGRLEYATGPQAGSGIPGAFMVADFADGPPLISVAFTDDNGDYSFLLDDGAWDIETPEDGIETRGAVFLEDFASIDITGAPTAVPTLTLPAANAFFEGTLRDDVSAPVPGRWIFADRNFPCDPDCYGGFTLTRADGTFSVGVVAPASPATFDYSLGMDGPLTGLVGEQLGCQLISEGDTLTGRDLDHLTPTSFITGTMTDNDGQPLGGMCVNARSFPGCTSYVSSAVTECDGSYSLPVLSGFWNVEMFVEDFATLYGGLAPGSINRSVNITFADATGVDFIVGPWRANPHITELDVAGGIISIHGGGEGKKTWTGLTFQVPDVVFGAAEVKATGGNCPREPEPEDGEPPHLAMCLDTENNEFMLTRARS